MNVAKECDSKILSDSCQVIVMTSSDSYNDLIQSSKMVYFLIKNFNISFQTISF